MGITAKELSKKLNLSETAVSMALNNKPGVSTSTRSLVIKEAEKYGYDFSKLAQKRKEVKDIYFIIYRLHNAILNYNPIFSELSDGINEACCENNFTLKTMQIYEESDDKKRYIDELRMNKCAGIILLGTEITSSICLEFLSLSIPLVLLDAHFDTISCSSVSINNFQGSYRATNYLITHCKKQPGYFKSSYQIENFKDRSYGFERAVKEHGMSIGKSIIHNLSPSIDGAFTDMLEIIDNGDPLASCYFADNDLIAIGAIKALKLRGYNIPNDISVIGFDNISEGRILDPSLTTIDIPRKYMGTLSVKQLLGQISYPIPHTLKTEVSTSIVKRFSVLSAE